MEKDLTNQHKRQFECAECGKYLVVFDEIYDKHYAGQTLCMSCRPGELTQEQLSEDELQRIAKLYDGDTKWAADPDDVKLLLAEVKRLKAVERQNEELKKLSEHAARIIDSGMYGEPLRYDPLSWFKTYHKLVNGVDIDENN